MSILLTVQRLKGNVVRYIRLNIKAKETKPQNCILPFSKLKILIRSLRGIEKQKKDDRKISKD